MAPLISLGAAVLLLALANAHFQLQAPPTIGFDDDKEGTAPCGSFTPDFSKGTNDFHVGGEPVSLQNGHQQSNFLYRATLDETATGNWKQLYPIVQQTGLGSMCVQVAAPAEWVGKKGVLSVVTSGGDGQLFQCSVLNFISGEGSINSETCKNASGVALSYVSDPNLAALVQSNTSGTPSSASSASSTTAPSSKSAAGPSLAQGALPIGSLAAVVGMMVLGAALL